MKNRLLLLAILFNCILPYSASACLPTAIISASPSNIICAGTSVDFTSTTTYGGTGPVIQWYVNGISTGQFGPSFSTASLNNSDIVYCILTSNEPCANPTTVVSNSIQMVVSTSGSSLSNGLLAWYPLDANAIDNSGNGFNGNIQGAISTTDRFNASNHAFQFDGTGTNITIGDPAGIDNFSTGLSVASWVYLGANNGNQAAFVSKWSFNIVDDQYLLFMLNNKPNFATGNFTTGASGAQSGSTLNDSTWYHVVGTWDNTGRTSVYINGALSVSTVIANFNVINDTSSRPLRIGTQDTTYRAFKGKIDDVRIYSRSLNAQEISNLYNGTVNTFATISINASTNNICSGSPVTFNSTITGGGSTPVYQWLVNGTQVGTNSSSFTSYGLANGDIVSCRLISSDPCISPNTVLSNAVTMVVNQSLTQSVSISVLSNTICTNDQATFAATFTAGLTNPSLQWKINGVAISGATGAFFITSTLQNNDVITCELISQTSCVSPTTAVSNSITMTVLGSVTPTVSISASATSICPGTEVTFTAAPVNGGGSPSYVWYINGTIQSGMTTSVFATTALQNNDIVTCELTSSLPCASTSTVISNDVQISVTNSITPQISIAGNSATVCFGDTAEFTATFNNGGSSPLLQWYLNSSPIGSGLTVISLPNLVNGDIVYCELTSNDACASPVMVTSNLATITVTSPIAPQISFTSDWLYSTTALSYQWYLNGSLIPGATQDSYYPTVPGFYQVSVVDVNGCSAISTLFGVSSVGIEEEIQEAKNIRLYPNPISNEASLEIPAHQQMQIELYSIEGKLLKILYNGASLSEPISLPISTSDLINGVYFIVVKEQRSEFSLKIIVIH